MDVAGAFTVGAAVGVTAGVTVGAFAVGAAWRRRNAPYGPVGPAPARPERPATNAATAASERPPTDAPGGPGGTPESAVPGTAGQTPPGPESTQAPPGPESGGQALPGTAEGARTQPATVDSATAPSVTTAASPTDPVDKAATAGHGAAGGPNILDRLTRLSLGVLRIGVLVLNADDAVVFANPSAGQLGLVRYVDGRPTVGHSVLRSLAARVRRSGETRDVELELPRAGREPLGVRVRVVALQDGHATRADSHAAPGDSHLAAGDSHVAIEVEDMTEAHRVARVRRDFVANVSHELKTPVGALQLLSEALLDATDDPEAASRFAERIQHESTRLGRLVSELLELSRLQGGEPLPEPELVAVDRIVNEVLDRSRTSASAKEITIQIAGRRGLKLYGHERLLVTAVANLVDNAIAYSPENTTVTISAERTGDDVEISVIDEGIGIAVKDQGRIFERFYRADPARSRATGGTGLGLAIVKHIATNHGGHVSVQSVFGHGSTFTLRLPAGHPGVGSAAHRDGELSGTALISARTQGSANPGTTPGAAPATSQGPAGFPNPPAGPAITDVRQ